jgi:hypothetical protein
MGVARPAAATPRHTLLHYDLCLAQMIIGGSFVPIMNIQRIWIAGAR